MLYMKIASHAFMQHCIAVLMQVANITYVELSMNSCLISSKSRLLHRCSLSEMLISTLTPE